MCGYKKPAFKSLSILIKLAAPSPWSSLFFLTTSAQELLFQAASCRF